MATGLIFFVNNAQAEVDLDLSGRFLGYGLYNDQDTLAGTSLRNSDLRKETIIDVEGTKTLDNGLTVGFATELDLDRPDSDEFIDTSFATLSGGFGEFYFGENDGIVAILQVEAPAADPYVDGIDPKINAFDISELGGGDNIPDGFGYLQEPIGKATKIGYTTPSLNGLQVGISYAPTVDDSDLASGAAAALDNEAGEAQNGAELAVRYEQDMLGSKVILGAGVSHADMEQKEAVRTDAGSDDRLAYNAGVHVALDRWTAGVAAVQDNNAIDQNGDTLNIRGGYKLCRHG